MVTLEEVISMKKEGKSEPEIIDYLKQSGVRENEAANLISQARIKEAVLAQSEDIKDADPNSINQENKNEETMPEEKSNQFDGMTPSILNQESEESDVPSPGSSYGPPPVQESYSPPQSSFSYPQGYSQQEAYAPAPGYDYSSGGGISMDALSEIAEQIVQEKLSTVKHKLDNVIEFKNTIQTKMDYLDERLKRMERLIDKLQLAILQKVGDYVTNVEDIKRELVETQKSFKSLVHKK